MQGQESGGGSADELLLSRQEAERKALLKVFNDTRKLSASSKLMTVQYWEEAGCIPDHMSPTDFEMLVYTFLIDYAAKKKAEHGEQSPSVVYRSGSTAVGAPQSMKAESGKPAVMESCDACIGGAVPGSLTQSISACLKQADGGNGAGDNGGAPIEYGSADMIFAVDGSEGIVNTRTVVYAPLLDMTYPAITREEAGLPPNFPLPEGFGLALVEGMPALVPLESIDCNAAAINCDDIVMLLGYSHFYLYSQTRMSEQYAHWAFLALEDDRLATFADCVREESRIYPRPMARESLENEPFNLTPDEIEEVWTTIEESGEYPDLKRYVVSNGDVYFYSTDHLSPVYAESLAEWTAVERHRSV